jgi:hypothetical protein
VASVIGSLIGQIIGATIGALIGALIVQLATKIVAKFKPGYGMAYVAAFLGYVAGLIIGFVIGLMVGVTGNEFSGGPLVMTMIVGFFVQAAIYGPLIKSPEGTPIGFGKACMVSLIQLIIGGLILGAIVFIFVAVTA